MTSLALLPKEKSPSETTIALLELLLKDAREGKFQEVIVIGFDEAGLWSEWHSKLIGVSEKIGLLTRMIHILVKESDE